MKIQFLFCLFFVALASFMASCGSSDAIDCSDELAVSNAINSVTDELVEASLAFSQDPSQANCNNIRDVYSRWLDNLEDVEDCADDLGQGAEFRASLEEAREGLNNFTC